MEKIIVFEVFQEEDNGFVAECLTEDIFTQGDNWEELKANVNEAVKGKLLKVFILISQVVLMSSSICLRKRS